MNCLSSLVLKLARALDVWAPVRWCALLSYAGLIGWLMLTPDEQVTDVLWLFPHIDKLLHFLVYGFLALLLRWALASHFRPRTDCLVVVTAAIGYGLFMELIQSQVATYVRSFEILDVVANGLGAVFFWWISQVFVRLADAAEKQSPGTGPDFEPPP
jgi:VanZ family protein